MKQLHLASAFGRILFSLLIISLLSCRKPPEQSLPAILPLPVGLESLPIDSSLDFGNGFIITRISETKVLRTTPAAGPRKIKIKNSGNTLVDNSQKKSGNSDAFNQSKKSANQNAFNDNKKRGQQQNSGNSKQKDSSKEKIKDVGNTTTKITWPFWLVFLLIIAFLVAGVIHLKKKSALL